MTFKMLLDSNGLLKPKPSHSAIHNLYQTNQQILLRTMPPALC